MVGQLHRSAFLMENVTGSDQMGFGEQIVSGLELDREYFAALRSQFAALDESAHAVAEGGHRAPALCVEDGQVRIEQHFLAAHHHDAMRDRLQRQHGVLFGGAHREALVCAERLPGAHLIGAVFLAGTAAVLLAEVADLRRRGVRINDPGPDALDGLLALAGDTASDLSLAGAV